MTTFSIPSFSWCSLIGGDPGGEGAGSYRRGPRLPRAAGDAPDRADLGLGVGAQRRTRAGEVPDRLREREERAVGPSAARERAAEPEQPGPQLARVPE